MSATRARSSPKPPTGRCSSCRSTTPSSRPRIRRSSNSRPCLPRSRPAGFNHFFYCNSGSEGNDTVLRVVYQYWRVKGQPAKRYVISRTNGYHGSTIAGASLGGMDYMHEQMPSKVEHIVHIDQPYWYGDGGELSPEQFSLACARQLEAKILELGAENVAAFIGEPFQGRGRRDLSGRDVLARNRAHLPQVRCPAVRRRSDRRLRPDRRMVRAPVLRFPARPHDDGQGSDLGLRADGRGRAPGFRRRGDRRARRVQPRGSRIRGIRSRRRLRSRTCGCCARVASSNA